MQYKGFLVRVNNKVQICVNSKWHDVNAISEKWYSTHWECKGFHTPRGILGWNTDIERDFQLSPEGEAKAADLFDRWEATEWTYSQISRTEKTELVKVEGDGMRRPRLESYQTWIEKGVWTDPSGFFRDHPVFAEDTGMIIRGSLDRPSRDLESFRMSQLRTEWNDYWQKSLEKEWIEANAVYLDAVIAANT